MAIDEGVGEIISAAKQHPSLQHAVYVLVSDHGHRGGLENSKLPGNEIFDLSYHMNNTGFKLV